MSYSFVRFTLQLQLESTCKRTYSILFSYQVWSSRGLSSKRGSVSSCKIDSRWG